MLVLAHTCRAKVYVQTKQTPISGSRDWGLSAPITNNAGVRVVERVRLDGHTTERRER